MTDDFPVASPAPESAPIQLTESQQAAVAVDLLRQAPLGSDANAKLVSGIAAARNPEPVSPAKAAARQQLEQLHHYERAKRANEADTVREQVAKYAEQLSGTKTIYDAAFAKSSDSPEYSIYDAAGGIAAPVDESAAETEESAEVVESDWDSAAFARDLGLDADKAAGLQFGSAAEALDTMRQCITDLRAVADDSEVLAMIDQQPEAYAALVQTVGRELSKLASPTFGFDDGKRTKEQVDAVDATTLAALQLAKAYQKLNRPAPPPEQLIALARVHTDPNGFAPGKKNAPRTLAEPAGAPKNIYELCGLYNSAY